VDAGEVEVVEFLLSKGAELNDRTKYGRSPLHRSAWKGQLAMAKFLVEKGAELNATDIYGNTPLDAATSKELRLYLSDIGCVHGAEIKDN
jgi:ankyrin repeat protein